MDDKELAIRELKARDVWRFVEPALAMTTSALAEPIAGLVGLASMPFVGAKAGSVVESVQSALSYMPQTTEGQEGMDYLTSALAPLGEAMEGVSSGAGDWVYDKTGSPVLAAAAYSAPTALLEMAGLKGIRSLGKAGRLGNQYEIGDIGGQGIGKQRGVFGGAEDVNLDRQAAVQELANRGISRADKFVPEGFMMDMPVYHGSKGDIEAFDLGKGGETSGSPVGKLGVSVALDKDLAKEYAALASEGRGGHVMELVHRAENPVSLELDGTETNIEMAATIEDAWGKGYDAVMIKNYTSPSGKTNQKFILVRDPSQLRKPEAKFDPKEKFNPNLMASAAGASILYGTDGDE